MSGEQKRRFAVALAAPFDAQLRVEPVLSGGRAELDDYLGDKAIFDGIKESTVGAYAIAERVFSIALACRIGEIDVPKAWKMMLATAHAAQAQYASWEDYATAFGPHDLTA